MSEKKQLVAGDIMTEHVVFAKKETPIRKLAHLMLFDRISGVPVVDQDGKLCGMVTATDLFNVLGELVLDHDFGSYADLFKDKIITVGEIMTKDVVTFVKTTSIEEIIRTSVYKNIHTFPIVCDDKIVGIIGKRDILNIGFSVVSKL